MSKTNESNKSETAKVGGPKKGMMWLIVGIVFVFLITIILFFAFGYKSNDDVLVTTDVSGTEEVVEQVNVLPENKTVEEFVDPAVLKAKTDFINLVNNKRKNYQKVEFKENLVLSEVLEKYTMLWGTKGEDYVKQTQGGIGNRFSEAGLDTTYKKVGYSKMVTSADSNAVGQKIYDTLVNDNFYLPEYNSLGIGIYRVGNDYYVAVDLYGVPVR